MFSPNNKFFVKASEENNQLHEYLKMLSKLYSNDRYTTLLAVRRGCKMQLLYSQIATMDCKYHNYIKRGSRGAARAAKSLRWRV